MNYNLSEVMSRFVQERKKFGTQEKLADIIGINPKNISAIETGRINPSFETFIKMCLAIHADVNYIVYGDTK